MSDRQIALHALAHLEAVHERIEELYALLEPFRPMLARFAGSRQPSAIDLMQARRDMRRRI